MSFFCTVLSLELKSRLRSRVFLLCAAFSLAVSLLFAALMPKAAPAGMRVGLIAPRSVIELLLEADGCEFVDYSALGEAALTRELLSGGLHCGYIVSSFKDIVALRCEGSYLGGIIDELVLSAACESEAGLLAEELMSDLHIDGADMARDYVEELRGDYNRMRIKVLYADGKPADGSDAAQATRPLLYALMYSLLAATSVLWALLEPAEHSAAIALAAVSGGRACAAAARFIAVLLCGFALLLAAEIAALPFGASASVRSCAAAAFFGALLWACACPLRTSRGAAVAALLLLVVVLLWTAFSGALLDPALLPSPLGLLRFLSPAWWGLSLR